MAGFERLMPTSELKTNALKAFRPGPYNPLFFKYDPVFDALKIQIVPPETKTIVHYVDDYVGLLYTPDDLEIVGLQVEAFEHGFLPSHDAVRRVWRLSDSCELEDFGDMILAVERAKPEVAREVVKATKDTLDEPISEALEHAYA